MSDESITTPACFLFLFTWNSFFHPFTFSLCVSLYLKWISCRQHIVRSCFLSFQHYFLWLENLVHLHLNAILLVFFWLFCSFSFFSSSSFVIWILPFSSFPGGSDGKASVDNAGDLGSIPGSGRSPEEGNGNPLQYYCLENPMDRGAW